MLRARLLQRGCCGPSVGAALPPHFLERLTRTRAARHTVLSGLHSLMCPVRNVRGSLFVETWTPEQQLSDATGQGAPRGGREPACPRGPGGLVLASLEGAPSHVLWGEKGRAFQVVVSQTPSLLWEHGSLLTASHNSRVALATAATRFSADRALVPPWAWRARVPPSPGHPPGGPGLLSPGPRAHCCSASLPRFPVCPESWGPCGRERRGGRFHRPLRGSFPLFSFPGTKKNFIFNKNTCGLT